MEHRHNDTGRNFLLTAALICICIFQTGCSSIETYLDFGRLSSAENGYPNQTMISDTTGLGQYSETGTGSVNIAEDIQGQQGNQGQLSEKLNDPVGNASKSGRLSGVTLGGNTSEYVKQKIEEGYIFIGSTQEGIEYIASVISNCGEGFRLCFESGSVDVEALEKLAFLDYEETGNYYQVNLRSYSGHKSENELNMVYEWYSSQEEETILNNEIQLIYNEIKGSTDYETIKNIHNYVCQRVDYCYDTAQEKSENYSAYNALYCGKAVCSGYALLFQKFMDRVGIKSVIATGERDNGSSESVMHAWNLVCLDGLWYSIDCTWDGQGTDTRYKYFLQGKESFGYETWGDIVISERDYLEGAIPR